MASASGYWASNSFDSSLYFDLGVYAQLKDSSGTVVARTSTALDRSRNEGPNGDNYYQLVAMNAVLASTSDANHAYVLAPGNYTLEFAFDTYGSCSGSPYVWDGSVSYVLTGNTP
jgi:hypothetical protein